MSGWPRESVERRRERAKETPWGAVVWRKWKEKEQPLVIDEAETTPPLENGKELKTQGSEQQERTERTKLVLQSPAQQRWYLAGGRFGAFPMKFIGLQNSCHPNPCFIT